jgi:hypothetical protein
MGASVAGQLSSTPASTVMPKITPAPGALLQRACACGQHSGGGGECEECKKKHEGTLRRAAVNSSPVHTVPAIVNTVLREPGQPLDAATRSFMEPRFGHDFSHVRIHTDPNAAESALAVNALAYTVGHDVVFGPGHYQPGTYEGYKLMAHELTHVIQQARAAPAFDQHLRLAPAGGCAEHQAKQASERIAGGSSVHVEPGLVTAIQRDLATPEPEVPQAEQPDLTDAQIREAIRYNSQFYDEANTRLIQNILGGPVTGRWTADNIRAIAASQEKYGLKKDGKVGAETFQFIIREQELEGAGTETQDCLTMFRAVWFPVETAATAGPGGTTRIRGHHVVEARFSSRCDCSEFEYRQFIAGVATGSRGGRSQDLSTNFSHLPGGALPISFAEDASDPRCAARNYGHRDQPGQDTTTSRCGENRYTDEAGTTDQTNGCVYRGEDFPQIEVRGLNTGDDVDLLVQFRGEIRRNGRTIQTKRWTDIDTSVRTP